MKKYIWVLLLWLLVVAPDSAQAHGYIVRAIPEDRAVLERSPTRLQYWFSEALEPEFSTINVRDQNGEVIVSGGVAEDNNTLMSVRMPNDLPEGAYIVELRPAFASDGHVIAESRVFFVGDEVGGVAGQAAEDSAVPLEVAWKAVTMTATMVLFGAFLLYTLVLVPAWGNTEHRAGLLPPRVMSRLNWIVGGALVIVFAGNAFALIQQTMVFFNIGFTQALDPNFWSLVRIGSRFGDIWNVRMLFLIVVAVMFALSMYLRHSQPETVRPFWIANAWMMALVVGTFSVLSHAAGSLILPWLGVAVDWLHALAVGFWAGGVVVLVLVLPAALKPYYGETRRVALLAVMRRFSRWAVVCLTLVITSGMYSASNWIFTPDDVATNFGLSLGVKLALVALLVAIGAVHHIALRPERYARFAALRRHVDDFIPTLRIEAGVVIAVLFAVGWLSATPVPVPEFAEQDVETPGAIQTAFGIEVVMTISPGGPGVNTYDVLVNRGNQRINDLDIDLTMVNPAQDWRSVPHTLETVDDGLYVTAADDIDRLGRWWTLMDITENGETRRLAFEWDIAQEASVIQSRPLGVSNLIALGLLLGALGWALFPSAQAAYHKLDLSLVTLVISIGITVIAVVFIIMGYNMVQGTREQFEDRLQPPPEVVNAVLPTQASLERGEQLYIDHCIQWQSFPTDFTALRDRLERVRDNELYAALTEGWRDLPACGTDLSQFERWDVVNYLRTLGER